MANKKNLIKKRKKKELKQINLKIMANCRRVAASRKNMKHADDLDQNKSEGSLATVDQEKKFDVIDDNLSNDGHFVSERTVLQSLENITVTTQDGNPEIQVIDNDGFVPANLASSSKQRVYKGENSNMKIIKTKAIVHDKNVSDGGERLIIDKGYFFEKLKAISNHAPQFGCTLTNLHITGETKIGLRSKLKFSCDMCNEEFIVDTSDPMPSENLDINTAAVSGITSTGIGLEQFQELCAAMNLPIMTQYTFDKKNTEVCKHWEKTAHKVMAAAAERERRAAIEEGRTKDGIAVIDVIADGCWSKRSYKSNYAALSGAAAIVGRKFGEVLFMGVKNKYCCICARAQGKQVLPKEHKCFKNHSGSSSGMEADIIAEGFKKSLEMYNVIYGRVIADGDSSTYARILEERPYKDTTVEKIECRNHILRNMCNKLVSVSKDTKYPLHLRKMLTTQRILAIRKVVCSAIKKHKNDDADLGVRINNLFVDISNAYNHAFGHHNACGNHYCNSEKKNEDLVPKVQSSAFWTRIQYIVGVVATHARSLINDCDSNAVEQFNSIIAKFVGGKRTNLIQRHAYQSRCAGAVVAFNTKRPIYNVQKSLLGKSPKTKAKAFEVKRLRINKLRRNVNCARKINFTKKMTLSSSGDKNYGTDSCQRPDMKEDIYEMAKRSFLKKLEKSDLKRSQIERATILQRNSSEWLELRRNLLTASNFGKIIKRRATTSASIVKSLLYKSDISNVTSIKHGIENETVALNQLAEQEGVQISPCGLFIDSEIPFLAATPDGLVGEDTIVEIKCPLSAFKMPIKDAVEKKKINIWEVKDNKMVINKNHSWYYQVQGQLHISKRNTCLFAVWSGEDQMVAVERIIRDDDFWEKKMFKKLTDFYTDHLLPELVDPRQTRNMPLRQPTIIPKKRQYKEPTNAGPSKLTRIQFGPEKSNSELVHTDIREITAAEVTKYETQKVLSVDEY